MPAKRPKQKSLLTAQEMFDSILRVWLIKLSRELGEWAEGLVKETVNAGVCVSKRIFYYAIGWMVIFIILLNAANGEDEAHASHPPIARPPDGGG